MTPEQHYRRIFFYETIDLICERLRVRIEDKRSSIPHNIEQILRGAWLGHINVTASLDTVCGHFRDDFDKLVEVVSTAADSRKSLGWRTACHYPADSLVNLPQTGSVPSCAVVYALSPASTATREKSFSTFRRMKTYLRSTLTQRRLNHTMLLTIYKERLDHLVIRHL